MPGLSIAIDFSAIEAAAIGARAAMAALADATLLRAAQGPLRASIRAEAPAKTGNLRASLRWEGGNLYGAAYGPLVVGGTRPHVIMPRSKQALFWPGAAHPVRVVHHPGTKPNDFVRRGTDKAVPAIRLLMLASGRRVLTLMASRA